MKNQLDRGDFLRTTGVIAAGVGLASLDSSRLLAAELAANG